MTVWIEQLGHRHHVQLRTRFNETPVTVGRSYACDFVIEEGEAGLQHLSIELNEAGQPVVRACDTQVFEIVGGDVAQREAVLDANTVIRIGKTLLRVRTPADVAVSAVGGHGAQLGEITRSCLPAVAGLVWMDVVLWLESFDGNVGSHIISASLGMLILLAVAITLGAMASYAINREGRVFRQLRIMGYCHLGVVGLGSVLDTLQSATGIAAPYWFSGFFITVSIVLAVFAMIAVLVDRLHTRWFAGLGLVTAMLLGLGISLSGNDYRELGARPDVAQLGPGFLQWVPSRSQADVLKVLGDMEQEVAATRTGEIPDSVRN